MSLEAAAIASADAQARRLAIDPTRSVLLQAPAGSGKTTVLTQRFLALLAQVDSPEQILAVTFTRKAAAEMRSRVLTALQGRAPQPGNDVELLTATLAKRALQRSRERRWGLESNPARLQILTIDGLNRALASSLPLSAELDGDLPVTEDPARLYREAARSVLELAESDPALQAHSARLLQHIDNQWLRGEALIAELLAVRSHWLRRVFSDQPAALRSAIEASAGRIIAATLQNALATLGADRVREGWSLLAGAAARLAVEQPQGDQPWQVALQSAPPDLKGVAAADVSALPWWRALLWLACTATEAGDGTRFLRKRVNRSIGFPPKHADTQRMHDWLSDLGSVERAAAELAQIGRLPDPNFAPADAETLESLFVLLRIAAAALRVAMQAAARVDYPEVAQAALHALTSEDSGSDWAQVQGERLNHILIDEFQDTSFEQFELVKRLTRDWRAGAGSGAADAGRTLFAVGDPMQSIYQFREAEVGLFLQARERGVGEVRMDALALQDNFRSQPAVVEWINQHFAALFPGQDDARDAAVRYLPSRAALAATGLDAGVTLHALPAADPAAEADCIVEQVLALRRDSPAASIAILVLARTHATQIVGALQSAGMPVVGTELVRLVDVAAVQDLVALTRALCDPHDSVAWPAVLRAPWCATTLVELTRLAERLAGRGWSEVLREAPQVLTDPATLERIARLREVLDANRARRAQESLAVCVEAAWLQLGGPVACGTESQYAAAQAFLRALADREARGEWRGVGDLEPLLGDLFAPSDSPVEGAIEVMTIHRAKGLEFDHVILPGLHRKPQPGRDRLLNWLDWPGAEGDTELLMAPIRAADDEAGSALTRFLRFQRAQRQKQERARLLYVACTRARRQLHLFAAVPAAAPTSTAADAAAAADDKWRPPAGSLLATLWSACAEEFRAAASRHAAAAAAAAPTVAAVAQAVPKHPGLRRLSALWRQPDVGPDLRVTRLAVSSTEAREAPQYDWAGQVLRHVGTQVHREFDRVARADVLPDAAAVPDWTTRLARGLSALGVEPARLGDATARVRRALQVTLADQRGRWILGEPRAAGAQSELALSGLVDGRLISAVIDRCFVDADGLRWVIDFKTSEHEGGDLPGFVANEVARYRGQLRRYATLAAGLGPEPVRAALYFPLLGARWVEVDVGR